MDSSTDIEVLRNEYHEALKELTEARAAAAVFESTEPLNDHDAIPAVQMGAEARAAYKRQAEAEKRHAIAEAAYVSAWGEARGE